MVPELAESRPPDDVQSWLDRLDVGARRNIRSTILTVGRADLWICIRLPVAGNIGRSAKTSSHH